MRVLALLIGWLSMMLWIIASVAIALTLRKALWIGAEDTAVAVAGLAGALVGGVLLVIFRNVRKR